MEAIKLYPSKKIGLLKWETKVVSPRCTWYFNGWTKKGSARQAMAQFKELTREHNNNTRSNA